MKRHFVLFASLIIGIFASPFLVGSHAIADNVLKLKGNIQIEGDLVRLGDLFENAGEFGDIAAFRAPEPGKSGILSTRRIGQAAQERGLRWTNPLQLRDIVVSRAGANVPLATIKNAIANKIAQRLKINPIGLQKTLDINMGKRAPSLIIPANAPANIEVLHFSYDEQSGVFRAVIAAPVGQKRIWRQTYKGRAVKTELVPVLVNAKKRGQIISATDLRMEKRTLRRLKPETLLEKASIIGQAARQSMRPGQAMRPRDLERPKLVTKNTPVFITYNMVGMRISIRARAITAGALNEGITVVNPKSKRQFQAIVTGPGRARVILNLPQTAALTN